MSYNYRCTSKRKCGKAVTFKKKIEMYVKRPMCPGCGKDTLKDETAREKLMNKKRACKCDGYPYTHRKGTEPWCDHAKVGPTDDDQRERYG